MPQAKYVKRDYKKKFKTYNNVMVAVNRGTGKSSSERKNLIKQNTSGSDTFNLTDKDIEDILKVSAHLY